MSDSTVARKHFHIFPTRLATIDMIKRFGLEVTHPDAVAAGMTAADIIAKLFSMSDRSYAESGGCDHCDDNGKCLGHLNGGVR